MNSTPPSRLQINYDIPPPNINITVSRYYHMFFALGSLFRGDFGLTLYLHPVRQKKRLESVTEPFPLLHPPDLSHRRHMLTSRTSSNVPWHCILWSWALSPMLTLGIPQNHPSDLPICTLSWTQRLSNVWEMVASRYIMVVFLGYGFNFL